MLQINAHRGGRQCHALDNHSRIDAHTGQRDPAGDRSRFQAISIGRALRIRPVKPGSGDDILYLTGSGNKQLLGGSGVNKYVIMPSFISNNKTSVMVGDFKKGSGDIIDLSNIPSIQKVDNLKFEEMELEGYIFTVIHISENKDIALLGIEMGKVDSEYFIFHDMH